MINEAMLGPRVPGSQYVLVNVATLVAESVAVSNAVIAPPLVGAPLEGTVKMRVLEILGVNAD